MISKNLKIKIGEALEGIFILKRLKLPVFYRFREDVLVNVLKIDSEDFFEN